MTCLIKPFVTREKRIATRYAYLNNVELIMTMPLGLPTSTALRLACIAVAALGLASCQNGNKGGGSPYASSEGGGYNPYPSGGGGAATTGSLTPSGNQPQYAEAPPPPPPGYDRPSEHFETEPAPRHHTSSSGSGHSSSKSTKSKGKGKTSVASSSSSKKGKGGYVASGGNVHTVTKGDTLYGIATHNHTTVAKLRTLNHMKSNVVSPGQKIKVK